MTNEERIKSLSTEELAREISGNCWSCDGCLIVDFCDRNGTVDCEEVWKQWLKSEAEE